MPLSIFIDALPYNEIKENYSEWLADMQTAELIPNIAYSSSLHWQLYCNKYPDQRGVLVDWVMENENRKSVRLLSTILRPVENLGILGILSKKVLDRLIYRKNTFANIPFKLRKYFTQKGQYLFWNEKIYRKEAIFEGYEVISQDEGHRTFEQTLDALKACVNSNKKDIFAAFGFADSIGHKVRRGKLYTERLKPYMDKLKTVISDYQKNYPNEEVLIVSDHGMSTVNNAVHINLEDKFGKQSKNTYIAYCDTAVMCIWVNNKTLVDKISDYLKTIGEGHLLTEEERKYYGVTNKDFGDIIFILREGNVFSNNWFGKSIKKPNPDGHGMHGFWPERSAKDQMACIILSGNKRKIDELYDYYGANKLITEVMKGGQI